MNPYVIKASGEREEFSFEKFINSLKRSGVKEHIIDAVKDDVNSFLYDGITTKELYKRAFRSLRKHKHSIAARYSLKKAIMQLGPTGYPFEQFIGNVFEVQGYKTRVGVNIEGNCVSHEIDVIANKDNKQCIVECKYHNSQGKYCGVQVPLYVRSRVDDIVNKRKGLNEYSGIFFQGWIATNTRFTNDAMQYGKCAGLYLLSWDYPKNKGLKDIIEKHKIFPVTVLTQLNKKQKEFLLEKKVVLCRQLKDSPGILSQMGLAEQKQKKIIRELEELGLE